MLKPRKLTISQRMVEGAKFKVHTEFSLRIVVAEPLKPGEYLCRKEIHILEVRPGTEIVVLKKSLMIDLGTGEMRDYPGGRFEVSKEMRCSPVTVGGNECIVVQGKEIADNCNQIYLPDTEVYKIRMKSTGKFFKCRDYEGGIEVDSRGKEYKNKSGLKSSLRMMTRSFDESHSEETGQYWFANDEKPLPIEILEDMEVVRFKKISKTIEVDEEFDIVSYAVGAKLKV